MKRIKILFLFLFLIILNNTFQKEFHINETFSNNKTIIKNFYNKRNQNDSILRIFDNSKKLSKKQKEEIINLLSKNSLFLISINHNDYIENLNNFFNKKCKDFYNICENGFLIDINIKNNKIKIIPGSNKKNILNEINIEKIINITKNDFDNKNYLGVLKKIINILNLNLFKKFTNCLKNIEKKSIKKILLLNNYIKNSFYNLKNKSKFSFNFKRNYVKFKELIKNKKFYYFFIPLIIISIILGLLKFKKKEKIIDNNNNYISQTENNENNEKLNNKKIDKKYLSFINMINKKNKELEDKKALINQNDKNKIENDSKQKNRRKISENLSNERLKNKKNDDKKDNNNNDNNNNNNNDNNNNEKKDNKNENNNNENKDNKNENNIENNNNKINDNEKKDNNNNNDKMEIEKGEII